MTKDEIIRMAREADPGFEGRQDADGTMGDSIVGLEAIERFAALVAAAEREACAQVCEVIRGTDMQPAWDTAAAHCTAAIRARREK